MSSRGQTISKDESNILVAIGKLETQIVRLGEDMSSARTEIKEINTGITARLLNLESNSLSKIEVNPRLNEIEMRLDTVEDNASTTDTKLGSYWRAIVVVGAVVVPVLGLLPFIVQIFSK